ncbi:MAG: hypothetical protein ACLTDR_06855 [Adlercreutzia equolifaciens]
MSYRVRPPLSEHRRADGVIPVRPATLKGRGETAAAHYINAVAALGHLKMLRQRRAASPSTSSIAALAMADCAYQGSHL